MTLLVLTGWSKPHHGNFCDHYATTADGMTCERCGATRRVIRHYHYGSGSVGCLYDYGPETSATIKAAAADLAQVHNLTPTQEQRLRRNHFIPLNHSEAGADYAEITPCAGDTCGAEDCTR